MAKTTAMADTALHTHTHTHTHLEIYLLAASGPPPHTSQSTYSETSEEGTLWDRSVCPSSEIALFWEVGPYSAFYHTIGTVATYSTQIMATAKGVSCLEIYSYVRGYHAYKRVWEPARGEALLVTREATNPLDKHAVAIYKE